MNSLIESHFDLSVHIMLLPTNSIFITNTTIAVHQPQWTIQLAFHSVVLVLSLLFNTVVLLDFIRIPARVTAFTVYLVALLISNILYLSAVTLPEFSTQLYGYWLFGYSMCRLHNYCKVVWSGIQTMMHLTIAVNRLWAISSPMNYKLHHTRRMALVVCGVGVVLAHAGGLPSVIMDAMWAASAKWMRVCPLNFAMLPFGVILLDWSALHAVPTGFILATYLFVISNRIKNRGLHHLHAEQRAPLSKAASGSGTRPRRKDAVRPSMILSLTVASICVCWVPALIIFTTAWVSWIPAGVSQTYFVVAVAMYSMQALFDPLLFAFCLYLEQFRRYWASRALEREQGTAISRSLLSVYETPGEMNGRSEKR
ncbi:D(1) dopamine receptor-like [Paramacrobiotus metropolitanus]|uniref:D(1) dopamine receptor-like n=1 Tax=Paramacrobiotus metropolitanus TaxID=2943436 RepID=UPI002445CF89|nr:D(1) dopamine receptor-like [Paramacrobiotus metropolitanus]